MLPAEEFSTLVHEIGHEMLHRGERRTLTTKSVRETEAEAVAFVICKAIGLENGTSSADYILGVCTAFSLMTAAFGLMIAAFGKTVVASRGYSVMATLIMVSSGASGLPRSYSRSGSRR